MKDSNWYTIENFKNFIDTTRLLVFNSFGSKKINPDDKISDLSDQDREELNSVLSYDECVLISKDILKKDSDTKNRYIVCEDIFSELITALNERMISNILQSLVNKGFVETAFDEESNDFVFYIPKENNENPETD